MPKDVLITPGDALIQFSSSAGTGSGQILADDNNNLVISNLVGDVLLGDGASDVFIGDGTNNVDIVFEQNGEIRDDTSGKSITLGSSTTNIFISGSNTIAMQKQGGNVGIGKTTATTTLEVEGDISGSGTGSFSHGSFTEKVGIGTTSPDGALHIVYSNNTGENSIANDFNPVGIQVENTHTDGAAVIRLRSSDADGYILYDDNGSNAGDFFFKTDGQDNASVLTLLDGGNVGIGTESPTKKLEVAGEASASHFLASTFISSPSASLTNITTTNITASGNISASGDLFASDATFEDGSVTINIGGSSGDGKIIFKDEGNAKFSMGRDNTDNHFKISEGSSLGTNDVLEIADGGATTFNHPITASGNISGSLTSTLEIGGHATIGAITASSYTGSFVGDGSGLTGVTSTVDIDGLGALGGTGIAQGDKLMFSDAGTEKSITFSNLEDAIFGNVSGEATIAAGGALTIAANSIGNNELKQDDDITLQSLTTTNNISGSTIEGQTLTADVFLSAPSASITNITTTCLLYTSPSPRDLSTSRMPSSA